MSKVNISKIKSVLNTVFDKLFNTRASGMYILLFALVIGAATFVENDYGTSSAQKVIFQAWWFELLLLLFSISIAYNIVKFRSEVQNDFVKLKEWKKCRKLMRVRSAVAFQSRVARSVNL